MPDSATPQRGIVLLRIASLSVREMTRALRSPDPVSDPFIRGAITCAAGPHIVTAADSSASAEKRNRAVEALHRYITRMGGRATPFGLLAGTSVAELGDRTTLRLGGRSGYRLSASIDVAVLERIIGEHLSNLPFGMLPLRVNPMLVRVGDQLLCRKDDAPHDVISVRATPAVSLALSLCEQTYTAEALIDRLRGRFSPESDEPIRTFVSGLVDQGLLCPDTGLLRHGSTPVSVAADLLGKTRGEGCAERLRRISSTIELEHPITPNSLAGLDRAWAALEDADSRLASVRVQDRYDLRLNMACRGTLGVDVVRELRQAADQLVRLCPPRDRLADLRTKFEARYGDAAVPLLELADPERGLLPWGARSRSAVAELAQGRGAEPASALSTEADRIQLDALDHWLATGEPFDLARETIPPALDAVGGAPELTRAKGALAALLHDPRGSFRGVLIAAGLESTGALLGRFAVADHALAEWVRTEIGDAHDDENPCISAEVLYSPGGRAGNVLVRPRVCDEAVALAGATGGTIHPGRLLVRVERDAFQVYDMSSGARVNLYINSAYQAESARNDQLYVLLAALAKSSAGVSWRWKALRRLRHLPRVVCGAVIVSPERWTIGVGDLIESTGAASIGQRIRSAMPGIDGRRWIGACEGDGDKILPVDLESPPQQLISRLAYLARRGVTDFVELPHVEHPFIEGPRGRHVTEVCVSFRGTAEAEAETAIEPGAAAGHRPVADTRPLSPLVARDEWCYLQLFCGLSSADLVAARTRTFVERLRADGLAREWFFIRYDTDGHHVRVRVRASCPEASAEVRSALHRLFALLRKENLVTFMREEPYVPETRRYGGPSAIGAAEKLFSVDSDVVAEYVASQPSEIQRLAMAGNTISSWWRQVLGGHPILYPAMRAAQRSLWPGGTLPKGFGKVWRDYRVDVANEIGSLGVRAHGEQELAALSELVPHEPVGSTAARIVASVVHMHCNRVFACDSRRLEALAYEFALRDMLRQEVVGER